MNFTHLLRLILVLYFLQDMLMRTCYLAGMPKHQVWSQERHLNELFAESCLVDRDGTLGGESHPFYHACKCSIIIGGNAYFFFIVTETCLRL